ncbi:MAG TPA: TIR domain-containing protein [Pyrinomonadaceae bacterium]|nr:TIR domain-containing protein [Pyrinomonadaceae bacterium]
MRRVFVSYSRNNLDVVKQLIEDLQAVGVDTWYDQTLTGGQRWWDNILANIRECEIFVFALSPESWDSEACKSELCYVAQLGKPIVPVLVAEGININLLAPPLNEIQVTDYRRRDKGAALALFKSINSAPAAAPLPDPLPAPPLVPVSYLSTLKERIDSTEPLSSQEQITLFFELEEEMQEGRSPTEIRDLLLRLKRRDDLLAKIANKIDAALKSLEDRAVVRHAEELALEPAAALSARGNGGGDYRPAAGPRLCPRCRTPGEAESKFCGGCGAALGEPNGAKVPLTFAAPPPGDSAPAIAGAKSRRYICAPDDTPRLLADVKGWLDSQGFDSQQMSTESHGLLIQIKKRGGWRDFVGMSTSLNIAFHQSGDALTVQIGAGKWIDKAAVGTVSMFILWPLAITAGYGAWEQAKMPEKIFDFIGTRLVYR